MLIGIEGDVGSGKTVYMVKNLINDYANDRKIYTNLDMFGIDYNDFDIEKFLNNEYKDELFNATIGLDEITVYMDCRLPRAKHTLLMGYLVLQSRKRNVDIYYTTQSLGLVDYKRLVKYTKIFVYCQEIFYIDEDTGETLSLDDIRNFSIIDMRKSSDNVTQFNMNIESFYKYYDTNQIIEPMIIKEFKNNEKKKQQITKNHY